MEQKTPSSATAPAPAPTKVIKIPVQPTPILVDKAKVQLELLKLFDSWDVDNNNVLDVNEIIFGLHIAGIKTNPKQLTQSIYDISLLSGDVTEEDLTHLKNHEFVTFMLRPEFLGSRSTTAQFQAIQIIRNGLNNESVQKRLKKELLRAKSLKVSSTITQQQQQEENSKSYDPKFTRAEANPMRPNFLRSNTGSEPLQSSHLIFDHDERIKREECCFAPIYNYVVQSYRVRLFFWFMCWWLTGMCFYVFVNSWNVAQGLYYAIQAGFSIGFGSLSEEKEHGMNSFEYCVSSHNRGFNGSATSDNNTAVALFQKVQDHWNTQSPEEENKQHVLCAYQYIVNPNTVGSMLYTCIHICVGAILIGGILSYFSLSSIEASEKWYDEEEDEETMTMAKQKLSNRGLVGIFLYRWESLKIWIGNHPSSVGAWGLLVVWLCLGAVGYELCEGGGVEGAPFVKGLYFAVAAASTGGLAGPTPSNTGSVVFSCFFCLVGVPLYAHSLGEIANVFSKKYIQQKGKERRSSAITEKELAWMNRLGDGDGVIDRYEFAMLWFLRNGLIRPEHVKDCKCDFDDLDADANGIFSKSEMQVSAFFQSYDQDHDGELTMKNLTQIAHKLQQIPSVEYPGKFLLDPKIAYDENKIAADMYQYDKQRKVVHVSHRDLNPGHSSNLGNGGETEDLEESSSRSARRDARNSSAEVVSLNRKEFMQWWVEDFKVYVMNAKTSMLNKMCVDIQLLLNAIEDDEET